MTEQNEITNINLPELITSYIKPQDLPFDHISNDHISNDHISIDCNYTSVNYIIASYSAKIKSRADPIEEYVLQYNLCNTPFDSLEQVTIICPKPKTEPYKNYYTKDYWLNYNEFLVFQEYEGFNDHNSYDQWIQGYLKNPNFDYYILIEDDYSLSKDIDIDHLIKFYREKFPDNIGYLCSLTEDSPPHGFHAAISNGVISRETFEKLGKDILQKYYKLTGHPQYTFSKLFLNENIPLKDISDYYNVYFYDSFSKNIRTYVTGKKDLFLPVQMVYKSTYISHIPEIQPLVYMNILDKSVINIDPHKYLLMIENFKDIVIFFKTYLLDYNLPIESWQKCNFKDYFNQYFFHRVKEVYNTLYDSKKNIVHLFLTSNDIFKNDILKNNRISLGFLQFHMLQGIHAMITDSLYFDNCVIPCVSPHKNIEKYISLPCVEMMSEYYVKQKSTICHIKDVMEPDRKYMLEYFKNVWDYTSCPNIDNADVIFFIPNIIHIENNKILRNVFSPEERFQQLLSQVKSIQKTLKDMYVKIYVLELSQPSLKHLYTLSKQNVDGVVLFNKDAQAISYAHDDNKNKSEVYLIRKMIEKIDRTKFYGHIVKFGGRYTLNKHFNKEEFFQHRPIFRVIPKIYDNTPVAESIIYSIPKNYFEKYTKALEKMENILNIQWTDVEHLLYNEFKEDLINIDILGVSGYYAMGQYNQN